MRSIDERLNKLEEFLGELRSDSFGDQYGIADFVRSNDKLKHNMDCLSNESSFYQRLIEEIKTIKQQPLYEWGSITDKNKLWTR